MIKDFEIFFDEVVVFLETHYMNVIIALLLLIIGSFLIKVLSKLMLRIIYGTRIDNASGSFFVAIFKVILWIILIISCSSILGIKGNSFLVVFSSFALAIGLTLKDSLSNLANGIVIIGTRPFRKGDHVRINDVEGKIKSINLLTTEIYTFDNKKIIIPNSIIVTNSVINYTANPTRRVDLTYCVSYSSDIKKVRKVIKETISSIPQILKSPEPFILFRSLANSSLIFDVKVWVNTVDYWYTYDVMNTNMFLAFKENDIEIPFNQLDIHMIKEKGNIDEISNNPTNVIEVSKVKKTTRQAPKIVIPKSKNIGDSEDD